MMNSESLETAGAEDGEAREPEKMMAAGDSPDAEIPRLAPLPESEAWLPRAEKALAEVSDEKKRPWIQYTNLHLLFASILAASSILGGMKIAEVNAQKEARAAVRAELIPEADARVELSLSLEGNFDAADKAIRSAKTHFYPSFYFYKSLTQKERERVDLYYKERTEILAGRINRMISFMRWDKDVHSYASDADIGVGFLKKIDFFSNAAKIAAQDLDNYSSHLLEDIEVQHRPGIIEHAKEQLLKTEEAENPDFDLEQAFEEYQKRQIDKAFSDADKEFIKIESAATMLESRLVPDGFVPEKK